MSDNRTFVSYSRADSEFALKLASDLRAGGADVWLDQLDIAAGSRWDSAVEDALRSCSRVLVVLSPKAVASQNVLDEVSFAIGERKTVVPVLMETCTVPLRLHRLQHVDFTRGYDAGLARLLATLGVPRATPPPPSSPPPKAPPHAPESPAPEPFESYRAAPESRSVPTRLLFAGGIIAVLVVLVAVVIWSKPKSSGPDAATDSIANQPQAPAAASTQEAPAAPSNVRLAPAGQKGGGGIGSGGLDLKEETDLPALLSLVRQLGERKSLSSADLERLAEARYKACPFSVDPTPCSKQVTVSVSSLLETVCAGEVAAKSVSDSRSCETGYELGMQRAQQNKLNDMLKHIKPG